MLFDTLEALVPEDTDASRDIYKAVGGAVHLVSTSATAGNGAFSVITSDRSDDASAVLFVTDEAMVPADTDALRDVYLRSNGQTSLVSVGTTTAPVGGGDLSADGTHVVFTTNESPARRSSADSCPAPAPTHGPAPRRPTPSWAPGPGISSAGWEAGTCWSGSAVTTASSAAAATTD